MSIGFLRKNHDIDDQFQLIRLPSPDEIASFRYRAGVRCALPHLELALAGVPVLPIPHLALGRLEAADRRLSA
jgi:hypothetical protein